MVTTYIKIIHSQLFATGAMKAFSWGAHAWCAIDEYTLQFKVQGRHFKGHVRIAYNINDDLYEIHFGHWHNQQWGNLESISGVYCDQMTNFIDEKVEYVSEYKNR